MSADTAERDLKMVGTRVDPEKHKEIRIHAAKREMSIAEYLRSLIENDLESE